MPKKNNKERILFFAICLFFLTVSINLFAQSGTVKQKKVTALKSQDGKTLIIPLKDLDNAARYFSFKDNAGKKVQFFGLLDDEKKPHIAFDACEICFAAKKGYRQEGTMTVCNNCGNKYAVKAIGITNQTGGCWPAYLPVAVGKENISITLSTLAEKQYLFP